MEKTITYTFHPISACNMCGSSSNRHQVLGRRLNASQGRNPRRKAGITTTIMRCRDCGLIFSNPLPIPADIQDHYGVPPEEYWKEDYFRIDLPAFAPLIERARQHMDPCDHPRSLDIGAGIGKLMKAFEQDGFEAWGCEASTPFHIRAIEKMGIPAERLKAGRVEDIDFPSEFFDVITFKAVLEHLTDPSAVLRHCLPWLKPGGVIYLASPSSNWMISRWFDRYYALRGMDYSSHISPMHPPYHLYEFGLDSFIKNGRQNGYKVCHHHYDVCETFLPKMFDGLLRRIMRRNNTGMDLTVLLKKNGPAS